MLIFVCDGDCYMYECDNTVLEIIHNVAIIIFSNHSLLSRRDGKICDLFYP